MKGIASNFGMIRHPVHDKILNICHVLLTFLILVLFVYCETRQIEGFQALSSESMEGISMMITSWLPVNSEFITFWSCSGDFPYFGVILQHAEAEIKWPPFCGRHFQIHFLATSLNKVSMKVVLNDELTISQYWFSWWLVSCPVLSHYLNQ